MSFFALALKLDFGAFLARFSACFAREKQGDELALKGERQFYAALLLELDSLPSLPPAPPQLELLDTPLIHLQKYGTLRLEELFCFGLLLEYFVNLKKRFGANEEIKGREIKSRHAGSAAKDGLGLAHTQGLKAAQEAQGVQDKKSERAALPRLQAWLDKILIPESLGDFRAQFESAEGFREGIYPEIDSLKRQLKAIQSEIQSTLSKLLHKPSLAPYLVDRSVHFINHNECLLLKSGYTHAIKGMVLERSHSGFFYLLPDSLIILKARQESLQESLTLATYEVCKTLSQLLQKHLPFLRFLNSAFDTFDALYARASFARIYNLSFIPTLSDSKDIILSEFCHPALESPKPLNIACKGDVLMITGVNAGGKTMLLKSLLGACLLSKHLIPLRLNPHKSQIPHFKHIVAIISDPQNSANHISTFAGRMLELSHALNLPDMLLGVDEIELGTDSDEAASLYKVVLEFLLTRGAKTLLTTHHKHLAALMAHNPRIQLLAALYDEPRQRVRYEFMDGSIGKSYAFETAARYGIPATLIERARQSYGEDRQRLNELIERSSQLEMELVKKREELESAKARYERKLEALKEQESTHKAELEAHKARLDSLYNEASSQLKSALKATESKPIHQALNKAHNLLHSGLKELDSPHSKRAETKSPKPLSVGDRVKYQSTRGSIVSIKGQNCVVKLESGARLRIALSALKPCTAPLPRAESRVRVVGGGRGSVKLDLHGKRGEEAIEELDIFLSNALLAGYDEVLVYHGIGTGILSRLVRDFLLAHPKVQGFEDAPANMGGFGAKIVRL